VPVIQPTTYVSVEPDIYSARISKIESETHEEYGPQLKFTYTLLDAEGEESDDELWAWAGAKWNPKTKLYEWASAILGKRCPSPEEPFDYDLLIGKKCDVKVENVKNKAGQDRTAITKLYPYKSMNRPEVEDAE
jgi:hypothetical protein